VHDNAKTQDKLTGFTDTHSLQEHGSIPRLTLDD